MLSTYRISREELAAAIQQLGEFVAIPSVSNPESPDYSMDHLRAAADFAGEKLAELGFSVRKVSIDGSAPYVVAETLVDPSKPTLLLYAHYDVQPVDRTKWTTKPFVLTEQDGRLYGRGSSDDKAGIIAIIAALKAYKTLPVNVRVFFEGEEEYGSSHMNEFIKRESKSIEADALVIVDGMNVNVKTGTLTNSTRGLLNLHLEVKAMEKPIHSGIGCLAPDPAAVLAALMASLHDPKKIPGYMSDCKPLHPLEREILRKNSQSSESYAEDQCLVAGAQLRGDPKSSVYERIAEEPSISFVNGGWGVRNGGNSIQDIARCQIGVRLIAGQNPEEISKLLADYLLSQRVPGGLEVSVKQPEPGCFAWKGDLSRPFSQKYLKALNDEFGVAHVQPMGGALPFLTLFEKVFPNMEMIIPGVEDPKSGAHSHGESQDIGLFEKAINALIGFIQQVGN